MQPLPGYQSATATTAWSLLLPYVTATAQLISASSARWLTPHCLAATQERLAPGSSSISLPTRSSGPASVAITMPGEASAGGSPMKAIPSKYYTLREEGNTI